MISSLAAFLLRPASWFRQIGAPQPYYTPSRKSRSITDELLRPKLARITDADEWQRLLAAPRVTLCRLSAMACVMLVLPSQLLRPIKLDVQETRRAVGIAVGRSMPSPDRNSRSRSCAPWSPRRYG